jgi:hypothetical protein
MEAYLTPDEFLVKMYQWACADFRREIEEGFPLLSGVINTLSCQLCALMGSLPKAKRLTLASALVKHGHPRAIEVLNDPITPEEQMILESFNNEYRRASDRFDEARWKIAVGVPQAQKFKQRQKLIEYVKNTFQASPYRWPATGIWNGPSFDFEKGGFRIETCFYIGDSGSGRLGYAHSIQNKEMEYLSKNMTFFCDRISIYSWLGICQETNWTPDLRDDEVTTVGKHLIRLCQHFIGGISGLLDDSYLKPTLSQEELKACWNQLIITGEVRDTEMLPPRLRNNMLGLEWMLVAVPDQSVPFLQKKMMHVAGIAERIAKDKLGNDEFFGPIKKLEPDKYRKRIDPVLERLKTSEATPDVRRAVWSLVILELIGTRAAANVIKTLAAKSKDRVLKQEASISLKAITG